MKTVLIVDDEQAFLLSLTEGLAKYADRYQVLTAGNGKVAAEILGSAPVDLVVTDLKMEVMDGFELLAFIKNHYPSIPAIIMTAFGTPAIEERLVEFGSAQYLEKPLSIKQLAEKIDEALQGEKTGYLCGITLPSFLQIIEAEHHTCTLTVSSAGRVGYLYFLRGGLVDAETGKISGREAAVEIICWDNVEISITNTCPKRNVTIDTSLSRIILEASVLKDEGPGPGGTETVAPPPGEARAPVRGTATQKDMAPLRATAGMEQAIKKKLHEFAVLDGFAGVALFTPQGEMIAMLQKSETHLNLKRIVSFANNMLVSMQKAAREMGTGRGRLIQVDCEQACLLIRCFNEARVNPLRPAQGKAHIHLVLALKDEASVGIAKSKMNVIAEGLAAELLTS